MTIAEDCVFGLGIVGRPATRADVVFELGGDLTTRQVAGGLATLARRRVPFAEQVTRGLPGHGHPSVWRLTPAGRAWLDAECGPDDYWAAGPVRVPCGVGWPA